MAQVAGQSGSKTRDFCYLFVILFLIWLALTSSLQWLEVAMGGLVSLILAVALGRTYSELGLPSLSMKRIACFIAYLGILFVEIIKANFDVAYRVLHPKLPIKPGIVVIKTELKQDIARMILANSITLTPGTFTLDLLGDALLIHWIYVRTEDPEEAARRISRRFERCLKVIFG